MTEYVRNEDTFAGETLYVLLVQTFFYRNPPKLYAENKEKKGFGQEPDFFLSKVYFLGKTLGPKY